MPRQAEEKEVKLASESYFGGCYACHDIRHNIYDIRHLYILFHTPFVEQCALMILPCEVAVKSIVPAIKALMAKELVARHGLKQGEVAEILNISQSAVSKYSNNVRGYVVAIDNLEGVRSIIEDMTGMLMNGDYRRKDFMELFCRVCELVRETGLACQFCAKADPKLNVQDCGLCL
jgi:predicted transcriptional regulator